MTQQRCPNCRALNAEQADQCSLCGEALAPQVDDEHEVRYGRAGRPERRPEPAQSSSADAALARGDDEAHAPRPVVGVWLGRVGGPARYIAVGLGLLAGGTLAVVLIFLGFFLGILPYLGLLPWALLPPPLIAGGSSPVVGSVASGAVMGALVGAIAGIPRISKTPWAAVVPAVVLSMVLASQLDSDVHRGIVRILWAASLVRAAASGALFGYVTWLVAAGYMVAVRRRGPD